MENNTVPPPEEKKDAINIKVKGAVNIIFICVVFMI